MAGFVTGSEAHKKYIAERRKEYMILRALFIAGYDIRGAGIIMDQSYLYLVNLIEEFSPIAETKELL